LWHLEPSLSDPDTVYAGVEDAALFRSTDGGGSWHELFRFARPRHGSGLAARRGRNVLAHHPSWIRAIPKRIFVAISAAGAFRTDDGGTTWRPINRGLKSDGIPRSASRGRPLRASPGDAPQPAVGVVMQKHWDVMRTDDAGESWREISGNLPTDFGFAIDVHAHEPETVYVVPIKSDSAALPLDGQLRVYRSRSGGNEWEALNERPAATRLLRQRPARCDGRRLVRLVRRVLRHDRRASLTRRAMRATTGRRSFATCRPCARSKSRRCRDPRRAAGRT